MLKMPLFSLKRRSLLIPAFCFFLVFTLLALDESMQPVSELMALEWWNYSKSHSQLFLGPFRKNCHKQVVIIERRQAKAIALEISLPRPREHSKRKALLQYCLCCRQQVPSAATPRMEGQRRNGRCRDAPGQAAHHPEIPPGPTRRG